MGPKVYTPISGSKADGTVVLGFEIGPYEKAAKANEAKDTMLAAEKCAAWGYRSAEAFGGTLKRCRLEGFSRYCLHTKEFQCLN